jgi:EAL domain-containing protein (putative c-di-GMP-specific phosphodiesterase class I)
MSVDSTNIEIVRNIMALARNLDLNVTAEGTETAEQLAQLSALRCKCGEGYLFSKPLDRESVTRLLASKPQW